MQLDTDVPLKSCYLPTTQRPTSTSSPTWCLKAASSLNVILAAVKTRACLLTQRDPVRYWTKPHQLDHSHIDFENNTNSHTALIGFVNLIPKLIRFNLLWLTANCKFSQTWVSQPLALAVPDLFRHSKISLQTWICFSGFQL